MKRIITITALFMNTVYVPQLSAMQYFYNTYNTIKCYLMPCEVLQKALPLPQPLPQPLPYNTKIFNEGDRYSSDFKNRYDDLQKHAVQENKWPTSRIDRALLNYGDKMIQQEKEWDSWCIKKVKIENRLRQLKEINLTRRHRSHRNVKDLEKNAPGILTQLRQDIKSPYYKKYTCSENNTPDEAISILLNIMENQAYHDELRFLQTQLHKMELYWNMKPTLLHKIQCDEYKKQHDILEDHIKWFKNDGRNLFSQSYIRKKHQ